MVSPVVVVVFAIIIFCTIMTIGLCARSSQRKHFASRYWLDEEKADRRRSKMDDRHRPERFSYARCKELIIQYDRLHEPVVQPSYAQLQCEGHLVVQ